MLIYITFFSEKLMCAAVCALPGLMREGPPLGTELTKESHEKVSIKIFEN